MSEKYAAQVSTRKKMLCKTINLGRTRRLPKARAKVCGRAIAGWRSGAGRRTERKRAASQRRRASVCAGVELFCSGKNLMLLLRKNYCHDRTMEGVTEVLAFGCWAWLTGNIVAAEATGRSRTRG